MKNYSTYLVTFPYTIEFTLPDDNQTTKVTVESQSQVLRFGQNKDDVRGQMVLDHHFGKSTYAKHLLNIVQSKLWNVDPKDVDVQYTDQIQVEPMTDQQIKDFEDECLSDE